MGNSLVNYTGLPPSPFPIFRWSSFDLRIIVNEYVVNRILFVSLPILLNYILVREWAWELKILNLNLFNWQGTLDAAIFLIIYQTHLDSSPIVRSCKGKASRIGMGVSSLTAVRNCGDTWKSYATTWGNVRDPMERVIARSARNGRSWSPRL